MPRGPWPCLAGHGHASAARGTWYESITTELLIYGPMRLLWPIMIKLSAKFPIFPCRLNALSANFPSTKLNITMKNWWCHSNFYKKKSNMGLTSSRMYAFETIMNMLYACMTGFTCISFLDCISLGPYRHM